MKKTIFFLFLLFCTGCKKEIIQECTRTHTGSFKPENSNNFPIKVLRDGITIATLSANTTGDAITGITAGVHLFEAQSTTLVVPVNWSASYEIKECRELNVEYQ